MNRWTVLLMGVLIVSAGCGKEQKAEKKVEAPKPLTALSKEEGKGLPKGHPGTLPEGHPKIGHEISGMHGGNLTKLTKPVNIPEEVKKTWKFAKIAIVDKTTNKTVKELKVKAGEVIEPEKGLKIKVLYIVPHLVIDNGYTSASNEPMNPGIIVRVESGGKVIFEGPIYQKFPGFYSINHPKYELLLKGISKS